MRMTVRIYFVQHVHDNGRKSRFVIEMYRVAAITLSTDVYVTMCLAITIHRQNLVANGIIELLRQADYQEKRTIFFFPVVTRNRYLSTYDFCTITSA